MTAPELDAQEPAIEPGSSAAPFAEKAAEKVVAADELFVVPARNMVLFPGTVLPLTMRRELSVRAIKEAVRAQKPVVMVLQKKEDTDQPGPEDLHPVGTVAEVVRFLTAPDGSHHAVCQGISRCRLVHFTQSTPALVARIERVPESEAQGTDVEARFMALKSQAVEILENAPGAPDELVPAVQAISSPGSLCDLVTAFLDVSPAEKQEILETFDIRERMEKVAEKLVHLGEVVKLSNKIREDTKGAMDKAQRDYFLREQLRSIRRELGEGEEERQELKELDRAITEAKMPPEVEKVARKELKRLEQMPEAAAEYSMLRTYLELMTELPWNTSTKDRIDIARARKILDDDHYGLEKVKKRIVEFMAVRKLAKEGKSPGLLLVGPPGVGKTSLGQSIARAMNRKFVRVSLGGVHDEAEIRGHRRTYIGALPGNIVEGLRRAGSNNPVFMLDEMDKLGYGVHGDPSAALLEVLDPEQNHSFRDNYLGVPFDLRRVLFIGTANVLDGVPGPLRDRFEVIHLPGYTEHEKVAIAKRYVLPRQIAANGLKPSQLSVSDEALAEIVRGYTREAGVRSLEREISAVCRYAAVAIAEKRSKSISVGAEELHGILGARRFEGETAMRTSVPGVATGLAWTPFGGEILFIEASRMRGHGKLILTGQMGDVMKESAQAAITLVKANAERLSIDPQRIEDSDIHVHIPAGAIPKDGPSAGVALYVALVSLFTGRTVRSDVAMTGEISLRGLVLPIGGVKEKVLGALAAGIKTVLLPMRNKRDLDDVPEDARKSIEFVFLETVDEAASASLSETEREPAPEKPKPEPRSKSKPPSKTNAAAKSPER